MSKVYSALLAEWVAPPGGGATSFFVPAGTLWVVRDLVAYLGPQVAVYNGGGFTITDGFGAVVWAVTGQYVMRNWTYSLESRQVINPEDELHLQAKDEWSFRISGYALTLP